LVALFEQEKISFSASGLFVTVWAMGLGSDRKYCFFRTILQAEPQVLASRTPSLVNLNHKSCQAEFISASLLSQNLLLNKTKNFKQKTIIKSHKVTKSIVNLNNKSCQAEFISASLLSQNLLLNKTKICKQKTTIKSHKVTQILSS
jgi:hypothetical protein